MAVIYRFTLHSFDRMPKDTDTDKFGNILCITRTGVVYPMHYTEDGGWNTFYEDDGTLIGDAHGIEYMKTVHKGWLRLYEIGEENWFDQTMEMLEEVQGLQREYEGEQRNDDKSDALDELASLLDQAKDFAEAFS